MPFSIGNSKLSSGWRRWHANAFWCFSFWCFAFWCFASSDGSRPSDGSAAYAAHPRTASSGGDGSEHTHIHRNECISIWTRMWTVPPIAGHKSGDPLHPDWSHPSNPVYATSIDSYPDDTHDNPPWGPRQMLLFVYPFGTSW